MQTKEHSILFKGEMVCALLDGRKNQTRRIPTARNCLVDGVGVRKLPDVNWVCPIIQNDEDGDGGTLELGYFDKGLLKQFILTPRVQVGDQFWVKETWRKYDRANECACYDNCHCPPQDTILYRADSNDESKWKPSIFMPRTASRIELEVTGVRFEYLNDISPEDAKAEGDKERSGFPEFHARGSKCHVDWFRSLWDSINAKRGWAWELNRPVLVYKFERRQP